MDQGDGMLGFYFSPYGRICRKDFWLKFILVLVGLMIASELIDAFVFPTVLVTSSTGPAGPTRCAAASPSAHSSQHPSRGRIA